MESVNRLIYKMSFIVVVLFTSIQLAAYVDANATDQMASQWQEREKAIDAEACVMPDISDDLIKRLDDCEPLAAVAVS